MLQKNLDTNLKKSKSQKGNQNAKKNKEENSNISNKNGSDTLKNKNDFFDMQSNEPPKEFCSYEERPKILQNPVKYYQWIVINKWWDKLSEIDKKRATKTFDVYPDRMYFNPFS